MDYRKAYIELTKMIDAEMYKYTWDDKYKDPVERNNGRLEVLGNLKDKIKELDEQLYN